MSHYRIRVQPHASLYVGGYAQALGGSDGDTASDALGLLLPGSAVKGALREAAARLVRGAGKGGDLLLQLFGGSSEQSGLLRVSTLRPNEPAGAADGTVRNHVSLERATRQAAQQRLFQNRVTPALRGLCFEGVVESSQPLSEEELGLLESAAEITDQLGGGRGRGLGLVKISLASLDGEPQEAVWEVEAAATSLVLCLEAEEPLHLSGVKDPSNYVTSKDYLDGSTVRGAVAAALGGRSGDREMESLLGGESPASFGDGRPGGAGAIPAPMTLQAPKRGGALVDIAAILCAEACGGRPVARPEDVRTAKGTVIRTKEGWTGLTVKRRTVTRTARDHASGRSADGQLYSLEVLDPWSVCPANNKEGEKAEKPKVERLRFDVPVSGTPAQLTLVVKAAGRGLVVGGDRSRGFGRLRLVEVRTEPDLSSLENRHALWVERLSRLGVPDAESSGVLLALGPLAMSQERLLAALSELGLVLVEGAARRQIHGGWNARIHLQRSLSSHFLPGSTFIVQAPGRSALPVLAELERQGLGPGRPDGWGRLIACHPIHLDCCKEG
ncbi:MAG TPA: RAMP superfamily CRISPR-associated protein [Thermoanaerobaculia bacterium]|jgi:CRISPR/Cas system CSM-associated protein Csm3 (group 7 of RAMP superfamily)|nr:RAMP superfamily CRISPR-associated protein [Thermoanaerobaculia bacterium]